MGKAAKSTKKFAASGQLKKTIQARRKHQQTRKKLKSRVVPIRDEEESEEDGPVDSKRTMKEFVSFFPCLDRSGSISRKFGGRNR